MSVINVSNHTAGSLYRTVDQGGVDTRTNRLSRRYYPANKAREADKLNTDALQFVSSLKSASASLSGILRDLTSGSAISDKESMKELASKYNSLYMETLFNSNDTKAVNLAYRLLSISATFSDSLSDIGVDIDKYGAMNIDNERLEAADESGELDQFLTDNSNSDNSFASRLTKLADNVTYNTTNYVSRSSFGSNLTENFAYTSTGDIIQYTFFSTGLVFDYSF